jgi:hypothetical protein
MKLVILIVWLSHSSRCFSYITTVIHFRYSLSRIYPFLLIHHPFLHPNINFLFLTQTWPSPIHPDTSTPLPVFVHSHPDTNWLSSSHWCMPLSLIHYFLSYITFPYTLNEFTLFTHPRSFTFTYIHLLSHIQHSKSFFRRRTVGSDASTSVRVPLLWTMQDENCLCGTFLGRDCTRWSGSLVESCDVCRDPLPSQQS